jgi:radical SAM protein with 4Fe4S-binding SPASM domain
MDLKIDTLGNVYPCTPMAYDEKYSLGNIRVLTAEGIQNSPVLKHLRGQFVPRIENTTKCKSCAWKCFCGGGCMARAELNYKTIFHPDDLCGPSKALYEKAFFELATPKRSPAHAQAG